MPDRRRAGRPWRTTIAPRVAVLLLGAPGVRAATIRVPADRPTLQAGIAAAAPGDTVLVAPGTYTGPGNRDVDFLGRDVVVRGEAGAEQTIVDVQASPADPHRAFFIGSGEGPGAVLEGFTIENGYMGSAPPRAAATRGPDSRATHDLSAGGIKCQDSSPTLRHLVVRRCGSEYTGGGISIELVAAPVLEDVVIEACWADIGGGLSVETASVATLVDCLVTGNRARRGGGINFSAAASLVSCLVAGNTATELGGGVFCLFPADVRFERTIVWGSCGEDGGGETYLDFDTRLVFACSVLDPAAVVREPSSTLVLEGANVPSAPHFCFPLPCGAAPVEGGDYRLQAGSPCLPGASPCGQRIGPRGLGCPAQTPAIPVHWSRLKSMYRSPGSTGRAP